MACEQLFVSPDDKVEYGSLSGLVLDQETELPIAGAVVTALINAVTDTTDTLGVFLLDSLALGTDMIMVTVALYNTAYSTILINEDPQQDTVYLHHPVPWVCGEWETPGAGHGEWYSLGFEDKTVIRLRLFKPYLYACAGLDGLWRKDIQTEDSDWEYLGLSDTSLGNGGALDIIDVIVNSENPEEMLAAINTAPDPTAHGIYKTEDDGDTWFVSDSGTSYRFPPPWDDELYYSAPRIFLRTPYDLFAAGTGLYHTSNFGDSWEKIPSVGSSYLHDFKNHPSDPNVLWLGGTGIIENSDLFLSIDGGNTWNEIIDPYHGVRSIAFDASDVSTVYLGVGIIVKSTDFGASWETVLSGCWASCMDEDDIRPGHFFAATGNTTIKTENGGRTWMDLGSPNDGAVESMVYDSDEEVLYIGTRYGPTAAGVFVYR